jgi:hypothetical protein
MDSINKYFKYKNKYLSLKKKIGIKSLKFSKKNSFKKNSFKKSSKKNSFKKSSKKNHLKKNSFKKSSKKIQSNKNKLNTNIIEFVKLKQEANKNQELEKLKEEQLSKARELADAQKAKELADAQKAKELADAQKAKEAQKANQYLEEIKKKAVDKRIDTGFGENSVVYNIIDYSDETIGNWIRNKDELSFWSPVLEEYIKYEPTKEQITKSKIKQQDFLQKHNKKVVQPQNIIGITYTDQDVVEYFKLLENKTKLMEIKDDDDNLFHTIIIVAYRTSRYLESDILKERFKKIHNNLTKDGIIILVFFAYAIQTNNDNYINYLADKEYRWYDPTLIINILIIKDENDKIILSEPLKGDFMSNRNDSEKAKLKLIVDKFSLFS